MQEVGIVAQDATSNTRQPTRLLRRFLLVLAVVLLGGLLAKDAVGLVTSARMLTYPFQFDESEGMIVAETMLLDRGAPIYNKVGPDLFIAAPYPPAFYLLNLPGQHLAGSEPTFKAGRAVTIAATLFVALAIYGIVLSLTKSRLGGFIGAAGWLSLSLVTFWGSLVKPDMTAVAFGAAGLWWLVARPAAHVWWALPLFLLAFYTKQTAVAGAVAGTAWLLLVRPGVGLRFGLAYAVGAVVPSALLVALTGGGYYYHEGTFRIPGLPDPVHNLPWMADRFVLYVGNFVGTYAGLILPGMAALLLAGVTALIGWRAPGVRGNMQSSGPVLLLMYLLMSVAVSAGTGTLGGNHNHLLEWTAAGCMGLGYGAGAGLVSVDSRARIASGLLIVLALAWVPSLFADPAWMREEFSLMQPDKQEGMQNIFQYVTNNGGAAYSDNVGLMLTTHKRLWTTDPYTQTHATLYGRWDESALVAAIRKKSFSQVILRIDISAPQSGAGDVSPGILQALRDNYKLDQRNVENIYVPR